MQRKVRNSLQLQTWLLGWRAGDLRGNQKPQPQGKTLSPGDNKLEVLAIGKIHHSQKPYIRCGDLVWQWLFLHGQLASIWKGAYCLRLSKSRDLITSQGVCNHFVYASGLNIDPLGSLSRWDLCCGGYGVSQWWVVSPLPVNYWDEWEPWAHG
jgi:hypothetical protein